MAKKSNKTEHVLNLISKNEDVEEQDLPVTDEPKTAAVEEAVPAVPPPADAVEVLTKAPQEENELKIEQKLKIELAPEIGIKASGEDKPDLVVTVPRDSFPQEDAEQEFYQMPPNEKRVYLINLSEKLAREMVDEVMARLNVCTCPICKNDVLALALNSLDHNYVTTDAGKQYMLLEAYKRQYETDVLAALTKACVRVKSAPKH